MSFIMREGEEPEDLTKAAVERAIMEMLDTRKPFTIRPNGGLYWVHAVGGEIEFSEINPADFWLP